MESTPIQHWYFLRGLARESAHWGSFVQLFTRAFPQVRITCLDLPGSGKRFRERSPLQVREAVQVLRREIFDDEYLEGSKMPEVSPPRYLFALSLGAMVGVDWIQRYPSDFSGTVLINTSLKGFVPFYYRLRPAAYRAVLGALWTSDLELREKYVLQLTSNTQDPQIWNLPERVRIQKERTVSRANFFRQLLCAARFRPELTAPTTPVLLLNSLGDKLVNPDSSVCIHKAWGVPIKRHAWGGHDLVLDDPQWVIEAIREWLVPVEERRQVSSKLRIG